MQKLGLEYWLQFVFAVSDACNSIAGDNSIEKNATLLNEVLPLTKVVSMVTEQCAMIRHHLRNSEAITI